MPFLAKLILGLVVYGVVKLAERQGWEGQLTVPRTVVRLLLAGMILLIGLATVAGDPSRVDPLAVILLAVGFVWGIIELALLSALLFAEGWAGLTGRRW